ncbi:MAG: fibrillarin-like rRNA/tRNA 2'-O-methyltransferase [Candidatus Aenigmarchaeota archaeon]|nr:fibrillarin-like rRNA/tRNA 2'-O-methyltransferase [Candidatus Aenigmarchaeota archaeon]
MRQLFGRVFMDGKNIYTVNSVSGTKIYGERLIRKDREYREWDPTRSKLAAAILNGAKTEIGENSIILYLGASTGTTVSHVSDIIQKGLVYALEFSDTVFHSLLKLTEKRNNIAPLFADARKPENYRWLEECDIVYCDIAQPDQTEIAIRNCIFLKKGGYLFLAIKSQSIDVTKKPEYVYEQEKDKLEKAGFTVIETINLEPYEHDHAMIIARK